MPLTVFSLRGVHGNRRERIEAAVIAGGRHATGPHEVWMAADPLNRSFHGAQFHRSEPFSALTLLNQVLCERYS
jgi:hypothetical protein